MKKFIVVLLLVPQILFAGGTSEPCVSCERAAAEARAATVDALAAAGAANAAADKANAIVAPAPAAAPVWTPTGWYLGIGAGAGDGDYSEEVFGAYPSNSGGGYERPPYTIESTDSDSLVYRAFAGYEFPRWWHDRFAVIGEVGYANLGDYVRSETVTAIDLTIGLRAQIWNGIGAIVRGGGASVAQGGSTDTGATYAAGLEYVTGHLLSRLEYQQYDQDNVLYQVGDVDTIVASIGYRF